MCSAFSNSDSSTDNTRNIAVINARKLLVVTGSRAQRTEDGSHASDSVHLAGIESTPTDHIVQLFCMKMTFPKESDYGWMPGLIMDT